jgi:glycosyltransferase involved in cell wall biosynthesis
MSTVSICIPTYGMKGSGDFYLQKNLSSIFLQSRVPDEVIISDHSNDDIIENVAKRWEKFLNIKYYRNKNKVGTISANLNNCIEKSNCEIIDFMLQDDYYFNSYSLQHRLNVLGDKNWSVTSTIHFSPEENRFFWHLIPKYSENIYLGGNTIGSPSLLTMKKEGAPLFDESLLMLTDCDYYKQLYDKFGLPNTDKEITSVSCIWEGQSQNSISKEKMEEEIKIVEAKYK